MAKTKELATVAPGGGAMVAQQPRRFAIEGELPDLIQMPYAHLYQGTISKKEYGQHAEGDIIHSMTKEKMEPTFILLSGGWMEYSRVAEGGGRWVYKTRNRADVPAADLAWNGDEPPAAQTTWYAPAMFTGQDMPVCIKVKINSKEAKAAYSVVVMAEKARSQMNRSPLLWKFGSKEKSNKEGMWLVPQFSSAGEPPEDLLKAASLWFALAGSADNIKVSDSHGDAPGAEGEYNPDRD